MLFLVLSLKHGQGYLRLHPTIRTTPIEYHISYVDKRYNPGGVCPALPITQRTNINCPCGTSITNGQLFIELAMFSASVWSLPMGLYGICTTLATPTSIQIKNNITEHGIKFGKHTLALLKATPGFYPHYCHCQNFPVFISI